MIERGNNQNMRSREMFGKVLFLTLLPLLLCIVMCAIEGNTIWKLYLPSSSWNDEVFYYKQTEAVIEYGLPRGFFGYNENRATVLSFGAWNPMMFIPWIIWGEVFDWNYLSPIYCNVLMMMIAMGVFSILVKPDKKQVLEISLFYAAVLPVTRYVLSGMAESVCIAAVILILGLTIGCDKQFNIKKIIASVTILIYLILIRPYFILLIPLVFFPLYKKSKRISIFVGAVIGGGSLVASVIMSKFLCAEYFESWMSLECVDKIRQGQVGEGINLVFQKIFESIGKYIKYVIQSFSNGDVVGKILLVFGILLIYVLYEIAREKKGQKSQILIGVLFSCLGMVAALAILYSIYVGSRHLLSFIVLIGFSLVFTKENKSNKRKMIIIDILIVTIFLFREQNDTFYVLPFQSENEEKVLLDFNNKIKNTMVLTEGNPSYENTVIWVISERVEDQTVYTKWQYLYGIPAGMGISACGSHILGDLDTVKSRYVLTIPQGNIAKKLIEENRTCLFSNDEISLFDIYKE